MEFKDYYEILGVSPEASQDEIKRAFRKLARKFHPDVSKERNAEAKYREVGEAYEALKDPERRAAYDQVRKQGWRAGQEFRPPPGWEGRTGGFRRPGFGAEQAQGFSDFFESLFGGLGGFGAFEETGGFGAFRSARARRGSARARGQDLHHRMQVTLEEVFHGGTRNIQLRVPEVAAGGEARESQRTLRVKVPAGVTNGSQIRLRGQGAPGLAGGPAGDLYLEIEIAPHPRFEVEGRDVIHYLPIAPWEAALGATVPVPTLGGNVEMKIPPGAQNGQRLRLKGRGLPGKPPGNQIVVLRIEVPRDISERARELYEELARESRFNPRTQSGR